MDEKNWLQLKSALAKDRDLLVATGEEICPLDLLPSEVSQAQRYAAQGQKEKLQMIWKSANALAEVRLEEYLTESLQI
jgi:hypothetical protein